MTMTFPTIAALIWSVASLLRGEFKQSPHHLPVTLPRHLDRALAQFKAAVLRGMYIHADP
jgi:hypothetical protein